MGIASRLGRISIASVVTLGSGLIVEGVEFLHRGGGVAHALVDGWCDAQLLRVEVGMGEKRLQRKASSMSYGVPSTW